MALKDLIRADDEAHEKETSPPKGYWVNEYLIDTKVIVISPFCGWTQVDNLRWRYKTRFTTQAEAEAARMTAPLETCACYAYGHGTDKHWFIWDEAVFVETPA